jgi:D-alanyl-D-alanine carboxypeptidase (penicillin-binding protein 5/6)
MACTNYARTIGGINKMWKRISMIFSVLCLGLTSLPTAMFAATISAPDLAPNARSAVLLDADTGSIIYEKNGHDKLPPASITKVMTMLLIMEALERGELKWQDQIRVSEKAASMGGSQIFLEPGEQMSVRDMLKGIAVGSANDASSAMAERLGGTEERFAEMMSARAKELGMNNTKFQNSNGLPVDDHYSSAHDIALMSRELLKHAEITKFTGLYQDYLRKSSKKPFWLVNTNKLVRFYSGLDGLKTGFTNEARFCLTATAKRDHFRVIAVVMGEPNPKTRNQEVSQLLDFAFSQYTNRLFYKKGDVIAKIKVEKGDPEYITIRAHHPISIMMKKGENLNGIKKVIKWRTTQVPFKKGEVLGTIEFHRDGRSIATLELTSSRDVGKAGLWSSIKRVLVDALF